MATSNHNPATFSIGVRVENRKLVPFCHGEVDAASAEQVAAQLVALAHSVRDEARNVILNGGE